MRFLDMGGARAAERRLRIVRRPEKGVRVSAAALEALRAAFSAWLARQARDVRRMIRGSLVSGSVGNLRALKLEIIRYFAEETERGLSEEALEAVRAVTDAGLMRVIADTTAEENERIGQAWIDGFDARYAAAMSARLNRANRNAAVRLLGVTGDKDRVDYALSALAAWPGQRAQMMAANEACFATNEAMVAGYRAAGYKTEWQAAPSCCRICQRYDDQTITTLKPPLHKGCTCGVVKGERIENDHSEPSAGDSKAHTAEDIEWLRAGYDKAVENGEISALTGFEHYQEVARQIDNELVGMVTADGIEIKGYVTHFIDRVIGGYEKKREPVRLEDVRRCLEEPVDIADNIRSSGERSREYNIVGYETTINPDTKLLIQTGIRRH